MAFKMKAGKEGPMRKNFPSAFKAMPSYIDGKLVSDIEADAEDIANKKRYAESMNAESPENLEPENMMEAGARATAKTTTVVRKGRSKIKKIKKGIRERGPNAKRTMAEKKAIDKEQAFQEDPANREDVVKAYDLNNPK